MQGHSYGIQTPLMACLLSYAVHIAYICTLCGNPIGARIEIMRTSHANLTHAQVKSLTAAHECNTVGSVQTEVRHVTILQNLPLHRGIRSCGTLYVRKCGQLCVPG